MASGNLARRRSCSRASSQEEAAHLSQKDPDPPLLRGRRPRLRRAGPRSPSHDRETGTARRQSGDGERQRPRRLGPADNRVPGQQGGSRSREGKKIKREAGRNTGLQQRSKPCSYKEKTCTSRVEENPQHQSSGPASRRRGMGTERRDGRRKRVRVKAAQLSSALGQLLSARWAKKIREKKKRETGRGEGRALPTAQSRLGRLKKPF